VLLAGMVNRMAKKKREKPAGRERITKCIAETRDNTFQIQLLPIAVCDTKNQCRKYRQAVQRRGNTHTHTLLSGRGGSGRVVWRGGQIRKGLIVKL
jgi:hypothetical protein